jgi:hypothetical protein
MRTVERRAWSRWWQLPAELRVEVADQYGNPVEDVDVVFAPSVDCGWAQPRTATSDAQGHASTVWTLGRPIGAQTLEVRAAGLAAATFTATASPRRCR